MEIEICEVVLTFFVGMCATFIQRVCGFGLGIFAMVFLPHFISSGVAAVAVSSSFASCMSTLNSVKYRKNINFKMLLPLVISAFVVIPFAVYFSKQISGQIFKLVLGVILVVLSIYFLMFSKRIKIKSSVKNGIVAGVTGATLSGLFSTGGPPVVLYLTNVARSKYEYFACVQFYFAVINIYATVLRIINGIITPKLLIVIGIGLIGCLIGNFFGTKIFDRLNSERLKTVIYVGMLISGALMVFPKI